MESWLNKILLAAFISGIQTCAAVEHDQARLVLIRPEEANKLLIRLNVNLTPPAKGFGIRSELAYALEAAGQSDLILVPANFNDDHITPNDQCGSYFVPASGASYFISFTISKKTLDCTHVVAVASLPDLTSRPRLIFNEQLLLPLKNGVGSSVTVLSWNQNTSRYELDRGDTELLLRSTSNLQSLEDVKQLLMSNSESETKKGTHGKSIQ